MAARHVVNSQGRMFRPGKPLESSVREQIICLYNQGYSERHISRVLRLSTGTVCKIVRHFQHHYTLVPFSHGGSNPTKITDDVLQCLELWKIKKPSMYAAEMQEQLLVQGICNINNLPSISAITKSVRVKLDMTYKKLSSVPAEQLRNIGKVDEYLEIMQGICPTRLHFFDESSVIKTSSNRSHGSSYRGTKAIEVQRYASNASYTVNLLHSVFGVDYYNIIPGASNSEQLIAFFNYALNCQRNDGLPVFIEGDVVIMDNCGFHHSRIGEATLRNMLGRRGVGLLFQPPYSPHLNTCEYCFNQMKLTLKQDEAFSQAFTEMAIIGALENITPGQSFNYFCHCGYIY